ncbi:MAG: hypothetical protein U0075_12360 [Thermomicrobiales bacterium]
MTIAVAPTVAAATRANSHKQLTIVHCIAPVEKDRGDVSLAIVFPFLAPHSARRPSWTARETATRFRPVPGSFSWAGK